MNYPKPDFTKRSVKIAEWIANDAFDFYTGKIFPFIIICGAFAFTFFIDWLLGIGEAGRKRHAGPEEEAIYFPILIVGIVISAFIAFLLIIFLRFLVWLINKDYYNWYFKS